MGILSRTGTYIDGAWRPAQSDHTVTVINPYTEQPFGVTSVASPAEVDAAVVSADRAGRRSAWSATSLEDRIAIVERIRDGLLARATELATLNTSSMGMLYSRAKGLGRAAELIEMYIAAARELELAYLRTSHDAAALITRRPVGVVAAIVPWNTPIRSEVKKVIPALLAGCTVVLKPAPETPFGASTFAEICSEAGLPPGVLNVVPGDASTGAHLVRHPLVRKVAFTGSTATGQQIWQAVAPNFTRLQLELGGKSAAILLDDVDLDAALPWLSQGIFSGSGQQCIATSRILAPRSRYAEVVEAMAAAADSLVPGDPFDPTTTLAPLVSARQRDRVLGYVEIGRSEGAKVVTGGRVPASPAHGWFVEPTILAEVDNAMRVAQEEIFGPVACIIPYDTEQEAIAIANDSRYGLGGSVYSRDPLHALEVAQQIDAGHVAINRHGVPQNVPFGGVKHSGIGREHGIEGYDSFLEYKVYPMSREVAARVRAERLATGRTSAGN